MSNTNTDFSSKCNILSDLWLSYKDDEKLGDFVEYNDVGLPLAFFISSDIVPTTDTATRYVEETWDLFLEALEIEDSGFSSLGEILQDFDL